VPETISLGRPVEPPEVGAFHDGEITSGRSLSSSDAASSSALDTTGAGALTGVSLTTMREFASSTIAASSPCGRRADTGCGTAPIFQQA
jgi:hypothetical protein